MNEYDESHQFEEKIRSAMTTPKPGREHLDNLRKVIIDQAKTEGTPSQNHHFRLAPSWVLATVSILLMAILLLGPSNVYAAIRQMLGFVPGIGIVEQNETTRVLQQPILLNYGEVSFTIEQAFLDDTRTTVDLTFEGLPADSQLYARECVDQIELRLPDGQALTPLGNLGGGDINRMELSLEYDPIPSEIDQATLIIPCPLSPGIESRMENQEFLLNFVPAESAFGSSVIIELPTPTTSPDQSPTMEPVLDEAVEPTEDEPRELDTSSISLSLYRLAAFDGGFVIEGGWNWDPNMIQFVYPVRSRLLDVNGSEIPFDWIHPRDEFVESGLAMGPFTLQASEPYRGGPLTLVINRMAVTVPVEDSDIVFDIGDNPYNGPWEINQRIEVAGHEVTILSVDAITVDGTYPGFEFLVQTDSAIDMPEIMDKENNIYCAGGGPRGENLMSVFVCYENGWPFGKNTFSLDSLKIYLDGSWEASWTNP